MAAKKSNETFSYLSKAFTDGHAETIQKGKTERIHYIAVGHKTKWDTPEEKVRAELWAELIYKYEYQPEQILFEVTVPRRTPSDRADIVVYEDKELKKPYFVFECKRADIKDAEFVQSIEQAVGNRANLSAPYCGAIAGLTRRLLRFDKFPPGERDKNHLTDIPKRYGRPPKWRFYRALEEQRKDKGRLSAIPREQLRSVIRKCHQTLWEGGKMNKAEGFDEFSKLMFIKHRDEKNLDAKEGTPYAFQRGDGETDKELADRICALYKKEKKLEPGVFTDDIKAEPSVIARCVEHLESISFTQTDLDTKGVAFEEFMGNHFKGDFGQFFTPRELIAFCVEVLSPRRTNLILDPACGSGGFLLYSLDYIRREASSRFKEGHENWFRYWHGFAQNNLFGVEINQGITRVAKMNMIVHDDGHSNIVGHDALDFIKVIRDKNQAFGENKFDIVLTNPPFGSNIQKSGKTTGYLEQFEIRNFVGTRGRESPNIKSEILFLDRIHSFLKPKTGLAAVILPDGILNNSSLQGVRDWILNHFQLMAVISLPQFAFSHYDAGVKSSIVFLRRLGKKETIDEDAHIFMALAENIGYDAAGRETFKIEIEEEISEDKKIERHSCDLFDYRVIYKWSKTNPKKHGWSEQERTIIPNTGLVGKWKEFQKNPTAFLV